MGSRFISSQYQRLYLDKENNIIGFLSFLFIAFLYLCFVGLLPFQGHSEILLEETGGGNTLRQILFLLLAGGFFIAQLQIKARAAEVFRMLGVIALMAIGWMLLSVFWSDVPFITFRRAAFAAIVIFIIYSAVSLLGAERVLRLLFYTMLVLVIASLISGPIVPNAVHRFNDRGAEALVGLWRGVFSHKNTAGYVAAFLFMMSVQQLCYGRLVRRKSLLWLGVFAGLALMMLAYSKTALLLFLPSLLLAWFSQYFMSHKSLNIRLFYLGLISLFLIFGLIFFASLGLFEMFSDPYAFTGRVAIWEVIIRAIADKPFLGFGYGAVFGAGLNTPLLDYATGWILLMPEAHNGYLDVAVNLGIIGAILVVLGFIILPFLRLVTVNQIPKYMTSILLALMIFVIFHNMLETSLLYTDAGQWVVLLIVVACIQKYSLKQRKYIRSAR